MVTLAGMPLDGDQKFTDSGFNDLSYQNCWQNRMEVTRGLYRFALAHYLRMQLCLPRVKPLQIGGDLHIDIPSSTEGHLDQ